MSYISDQDKSRSGRTKPRWTRAKSGCLTCRQRRKKCDERDPICTGCDRNHLLCHWPPGSRRESSLNHEEDATENESHELNADRALEVPDIVTSLPPLELILQPHVLPSLFKLPENRRLFEHYTATTASRLAGRASRENPFLNYNLQIAGDNEMMQHSILAISSSHLSFDDASQETISRAHYAVVLRGIKHAITDWRTKSISDRIRLLTVVMAICWFEVLDVNTKGALYHHLRASRVMLNSLQNDTRVSEQSMVGFLVEQYAYLVLVSNISFLPERLNRQIDQALPCPSLGVINKGTDIYGCLFGSSHQLYECITCICELAAIRRAEGQQSSLSSSGRYLELQHNITGWTPGSDSMDDGLATAGYMCQQACLIFLHTSFHGPHPPTQYLVLTIEPLIERFLEHFTQLSYEAASWTTISWPCHVAGSCMKNEAQREQISEIIRKSTIRMRLFHEIISTLSRFWAEMDADTTLYGPYGLEEVLTRYNINPCIG
ncbi:Nn.00g005820.m01.CDS01 [Neocucurbitaria sp. VM-36]